MIRLVQFESDIYTWIVHYLTKEKELETVLENPQSVSSSLAGK